MYYMYYVYISYVYGVFSYMAYSDRPGEDDPPAADSIGRRPRRCPCYKGP